MTAYTPERWFWIVASDESRAWSSAAGAYVTEYPPESVTRIASEEELTDVLRPYGLTLPAPTVADYAAAVQAHIDQTARTRDYHDGIHLASYVASTNPAWAAEAQAFSAWRDAVWAYAYEQLDAVDTNEREQPSVAGLVAELPAITWP